MHLHRLNILLVGLLISSSCDRAESPEQSTELSVAPQSCDEGNMTNNTGEFVAICAGEKSCSQRFRAKIMRQLWVCDPEQETVAPNFGIPKKEILFTPPPPSTVVTDVGISTSVSRDCELNAGPWDVVVNRSSICGSCGVSFDFELILEVADQAFALSWTGQTTGDAPDEIEFLGELQSETNESCTCCDPHSPGCGLGIPDSDSPVPL